MKPVDPATLLETWPERERLWFRELGRIRSDQGPVSEQLQKLRLVTWVITAVTGWIAFMIVVLFTAFKSPGTGLIVAGVIFGPIIVSAWIGFRRLEGRTRGYLAERAVVDGKLKDKTRELDPDF